MFRQFFSTYFTAILSITLLVTSVFVSYFTPLQLHAQTTGTENSVLHITPDKATYTIGETITVDIRLNTKEYKITGAEIHLTYPTTGLDVKNVELGTFMPVVLQPTQLSPGSISFIVGSTPEQAVTGSESLAKITFQAIQESNPTLSFTPSTVITAVGYTTNILDTTSPLALTITNPTTPTATPTVIPGNGLAGTYFNNKNFTGSAITRTDSTINFNWGTQKPHASIAADTYSVRWVGYVVPKASETYTFYMRADDGVRVWVNNQRIVDYWGDQAATERSGKIAFTKDQKYPIKIEYYENYGNAVAELRWSSPSTKKQVLPQAQLYTQ